MNPLLLGGALGALALYFLHPHEGKRRRAAVADDVLVERVRAELGRFVGHSHAVKVAVDRGHITLSGSILPEELRPLLRGVRRVPGVKAVYDRLTVYEYPRYVPALQGGQPPHASRFDLLQENWSPATRLFVGAFGAGLIASSFRARAGLSALLRIMGGALVARATARRLPRKS